MEAFSIFQKGGFVMYPLLLMSLAAVAFSVERFLAFRQFGSGSPEGFLDEMVNLVRNGRAGDALRRAEQVPGPVAAAAVAVLRHRNAAIEDVEREVAVTIEDYFVRLERFLPWLDTFTTLSPLLGLLGTILGMVQVFQEFRSANAEGSGGATDSLLAGVGEALYATAFGIAIAIFCFFAYNSFAAAQRAVAIESQQMATKLIALLHDMRLRQEGYQATQEEMLGKRKQRRASSGRALKKTKVEIIPMIDTMFFLLVFFILTSVGLIKPEGNVKLPDAATGERKKPAQVVIAILPDESVKVNKKLLRPGDNIATVLQEEIAGQLGTVTPEDLVKATITIQADKGVSSKTVVSAINEIATAGVGTVTIATGNAAGSGSASASAPTGATE
ncbi:MAG: MotA/TolQ/ExbB proton channel family protein [Capsulimonadales bacterium]|nr:MotA/TolQ/ExbB proton channel family protein [Capsulimonadales bacterium]